MIFSGWDCHDNYTKSEKVIVQEFSMLLAFIISLFNSGGMMI